jgi:hypothetical protein
MVTTLEIPDATEMTDDELTELEIEQTDITLFPGGEE